MNVEAHRSELQDISHTGAAVAAIARALGGLGMLAEDAQAEGSERSTWNTADVRGGLLLALEQLGSHADQVASRMAQRLTP